MNEEQRKRFEENRKSNARAEEKRAAAEAIKKKNEEKSGNRLRQSYRENADRLNPNPAVQVLDSHGRPREQSDHHSQIGNTRP